MDECTPLFGGSAGSWNPYPIDMKFVVPCMVDSHIGMSQAGAAGRGAHSSTYFSSTSAVLVTPPRVPLSNRRGDYLTSSPPFP